MSTPEKAVYAQYGVRLGPSPDNGVLRSFRIDEFRNGYLIKLPGAACFGSLIDEECFAWEAGEWWPVNVGAHKNNEAIRFEWLVWRLARTLRGSGEKLSQEDQERLALAVQRLESWL